MNQYHFEYEEMISPASEDGGVWQVRSGYWCGVDEDGAWLIFHADTEYKTVINCRYLGFTLAPDTSFSD